jgi:hypothetical protein
MGRQAITGVRSNGGGGDTAKPGMAAHLRQKHHP